LKKPCKIRGVPGLAAAEMSAFVRSLQICCEMTPKVAWLDIGLEDKGESAKAQQAEAGRSSIWGDVGMRAKVH
jgi:hypothetical protein